MACMLHDHRFQMDSIHQVFQEIREKTSKDQKYAAMLLRYIEQYIADEDQDHLLMENEMPEEYIELMGVDSLVPGMIFKVLPHLWCPYACVW